MYHERPDLWKNLLDAALKEDGWPWDWTSIGTTRGSSQKLKAKVIGKSHGIWAAESLVQTLKSIPGISQAQSSLSNGSSFSPGTRIVSFTGASSILLAYERPFLNLAAYVSGISTKTNQLVRLIQKACPKQTPRLTLTRKTLPHYRDVAIAGVLAGGGHPHRVSLSGGVLIKENHIAASGSISKAIQGARATAPHGLKIEIEVRTESELKKALQANADGVLLDNFSSSQVRSALNLIQRSPTKVFVEVSGGINETNITDFAIPGVDVISVGALTHSVTAVDLSFLIEN